MAISYQSDTSPMYVGRFSPNPLWLQSIADNQWGIISLTNKISDIDPEDDVLINPDYPSNAPWHANGGLPLMMSAWCGACFDETGGVLWFPLSGGHADYAGNEPYKIDISVDAPTAVMLRNPSGAIGDTGTLNDNQESSGVYFDGRPRAIHSYNKPVYVPNVGPFTSIQGNTAWSGQAGTNDTLLLNESTGETTRLATNSGTGAFAATGSTYDASRHVIWNRGAGTGRMTKYDIDLDTWVTVGAQIALSAGCSLTYIPEHDVIFLINIGYANNFAIFDCATGLYSEPSISGSFIGSALQPFTQPRLVSDGSYLAIWDNSTNTTIINTLTVPTDPRTDNWVISQLTVDAGNSVTPTAKTSNGTFGRFFYSPVYNVFGVINSTNQDIYIFKIGAQ